MFDQFFQDYGVPVLSGALFIGIAWILARWIATAAARFLRDKLDVEPAMIVLTTRVVSVAIMVLAVVAVLEDLGVEVASLIAALGIFGFAIAIGMRTTTTNFFTGVMVHLLNPYEVGDYVDAERVEGVVESISMFHTVVVTDDGVYVAVPNGPMWARSIRNLSRGRARRVELELTVGPQPPFSEVRAAINRSLSAEPALVATFVPVIQITDVTEEEVDATIWFWCEPEQTWSIRGKMVEKLRNDLTEAGIAIIKLRASRRRRRVAKKPPAPPPPSSEEVL